MKKHPTQKELLAIFDYDPNTGVLMRGEKVAGWTRKDGYLQVSIKGDTFYIHRVIWCIMTGAYPLHQIDHRNLDRADNRWMNLREATCSQNRANIKQPSISGAPAKGVEKLPNGKFRARVTNFGKNYHLGCFVNLDDAVAAYRKKATEIFGDFVR